MLGRVSGALGTVLAFVALMLPHAAAAKFYDSLPTEVRETAEPLDLLIVIPQRGMRVQYMSPLNSNSVVNFYGPIGGLIAGALERRERESLRKQGLPFDGPLAGFDVGALAMASTRAVFAQTSWLRASDAKLATDRSTSSDLRVGQAVLTYEYSIDPPNSRIFVTCQLQIGGTDAATGWEQSNLRYSSASEASIEFQGGPPSKQARFAMLTANQGARLRQHIGEAFHSCARLTLRRAEMSAEHVAELRTRRESSIMIKSGLPQLGGWIVDGAENTVRGKYGLIGAGRTFTAPDTSGVTLLRGHGLWHNRVEVLPGS
jgi:hypothetical protein